MPVAVTLCCHKNGTMNRAWQQARLLFTTVGKQKISYYFCWNPV